MGEGKEYKKTYEFKNPVTLIEFDKIRKGALHTFIAFLSNMGFSLKLAPGEAFYTVLSLAKGRLKKSSPSGKTQNRSL